MGCNCTKSGKLAHDVLGEEMVQTYETALGFSRKESEALIKSISESAGSDDFELSGLYAWLQQESLPSSNIDESESPLHVFYLNFKEEDRYSVVRLSVLSILLANASLKKKAALLYQLYDPTNSASITATEAQMIVQEACDIALSYVPQFAELETAVLLDQASIGKLRKYMSRLSAAYNNTFAVLQKSLLRDRGALTYEEFVESVSSQAPEIVNTLEIRALAASFPVKTSAQKKAFAPLGGRVSLKPAAEEVKRAPNGKGEGEDRT